MDDPGKRARSARRIRLSRGGGSRQVRPAASQRHAARWKEFFDSSPVPLWIEDFSAVKERLDRLAREGVRDWEGWFRVHPGEVREMAESVRILGVNDAVLSLFGATDRSLLLGGLSVGFDEESYRTFSAELELIAGGSRRFDLDVVARRFTGERLDLLLQWTAAPGSEERLDRVYVSAVDLTARVAAEAGLRASLEEKDALLRELQHRVRNNLAVVASLLGIQGRCAGGEAAAALDSAQERIDAMSIVHDSLYLAEDLARVSLEACVERVALGVAQRRGSRNVRLRVDSGSGEVPIDQAVPCGLAVNELVDNAYGHAFPGGREGTVSVSAWITAGHAELRVEDDGIGLPRDAAPDTATSLGFTLVRLLASQLGGSCLVEAGPGGTRASLRFPLRERGCG